jgi:signal transduction histidine kinase
MSLKKLIRFRHTLAFRLTFIYSLSVIILTGAFLSYRLIRDSGHYEDVDTRLLADAKALSLLLDSMKGLNNRDITKLLEHETKSTWKLFIRLLGPDGEVFASSDISYLDMNLSPTVTGFPKDETDHVFGTQPLPNSHYTARILSYAIGTDRILQIGTSQEGLQRIIEKRWREFSLVMAVLLVFSIFVGWFVVKSALAGIEEVTRTAIQISGGDFSSRVPITGRSEEIDRLAATFNNMVERIQALIKGMKEITDNMAHDLRSPVTRIRGLAEMTVTSSTGGSQDYELMAGSIVEECDRLLGIINMILDISEAKAGLSKLNMTRIDVSMIMEETCELFRPIAENKNIRIVKKFAENTVNYADNQKLQRVASNLLDNALKYTPPGGTVVVSVDGDGDRVRISVNDNGIGISQEDLPHIFRRFYRCDRSRSQPGTGLGLSWARAIIRAHGGNISVKSILNESSTFIVTLPRSPMPA